MTKDLIYDERIEALCFHDPELIKLHKEMTYHEDRGRELRKQFEAELKKRNEERWNEYGKGGK
jgi:hypothetical protein